MRQILVEPEKLGPDPRLTTVCKPIAEVTPWVQELANELMNAICLSQEFGGDIRSISLSAPQLGETVRMIAFFGNIELKTKGDIVIMINPILDKPGKTIIMRETCLSVNGAYLVKRHKRIRIIGGDLDMKPISYKGTGIYAQMYQHEVDHLDGKLISATGTRANVRFEI